MGVSTYDEILAYSKLNKRVQILEEENEKLKKENKELNKENNELRYKLAHPNGYDEVGMSLPMHKNILMNAIFDPVMPKDVEGNKKITVSLNKRRY